MPTGPRLLVDNCLYHIMVRGNNKQVVFKDDRDYEEYTKRIKLYKQKYDFKLYGYCLMPNHVHLIGELNENGSLAKMMHGLSRSYTAYFIKRYGWTGHLWQGRYKSKVIVKDRYALDCINYIELNPIRANIVSSPCDYRWSSYNERNLRGDLRKGLLNGICLKCAAP